VGYERMIDEATFGSAHSYVGAQNQGDF